MVLLEVKIVELNYDIEDKLSLRYGHKLRGYFANRFKEILFHNHFDDGSLRYGYPLIQYKIINNKPVVLGINKGADLIVEHFLSIDKLELGKKIYVSPTAKLTVNKEDVSIENDFDRPPYKYDFIAPWLGLNQKNFGLYIEKYVDNNQKERSDFFAGILAGNVLSFAKGINWRVKKEIKVTPSLSDITVRFKGEEMVGFKGHFFSNVYLPEHIGLGKSTSRGFGMIRREKIL